MPRGPITLKIGSIIELLKVEHLSTHCLAERLNIKISQAAGYLSRVVNDKNLEVSKETRKTNTRQSRMFVKVIGETTNPNLEAEHKARLWRLVHFSINRTVV